MSGETTVIASWLARLPWAPAWVLLLAKITLALVTGWLLHGAFARHNPRWRVLLWRIVALGLVALPLLLPFESPLQLRLSASVSPSTARAAVTANKVQAPLVSEPLHAAIPDGQLTPFTTPENPYTRFALPYPAKQLSPNAAPQTHSRALSAFSRHFQHLNAKALAMLWLTMALLLFVRWSVGWIRLSQAVRLAAPAPESLVTQAQRIPADLGCRPVELRLDRRISTPFIAGWRRPTLLLPERMTAEAYRGELPAILAHELSHLRAGDMFWTPVLHLLQILLWFHPLAWPIGRAHAAACEEVSDAVSADYIGDAGAYSRTLARVAVEVAELPSLAGGIAMARVPEVMRRLALLRRRVFANPLCRRRVVAFAALLTLGLGLLGCLRFAYSEREEGSHPKNKVEAVAAQLKSDGKKAPAAQASAPPESQAAATPASTIPETKVSGRVVNFQGQPVGDVPMYLFHVGSPATLNPDTHGGLVEKTQAGPDGAFAFNTPLKFEPTLPYSNTRDTYTVLALHPRFALGWVNIRSGETKTSYTLTITSRATSTTLMVTDMDGKPLPGARVWPNTIGNKQSSNAFFRDLLSMEHDPGVIGATTDDQGKAVITRLPQITWTFYASLKGYAGGLTFRKGPIRLIKGAAVSGAVTDEAGHPIPRAYVNFSAKFWVNVKTVRTDAQGHYRIEDLAPMGWDMSPWGINGVGNGEYEVSVQSDAGAAEGVPIVLRPGDDVKDFDFIIQPGTLVRCRLVQAGTNRPLAGALLSGQNAGKSFSGYTDAQGIYSFRAAPGPSEITFDSPPEGVYVDTSLPLDRGASTLQFDPKGKEMGITLTAPPIAGKLVSLKGRALDPAGNGLEGVAIKTALREINAAPIYGPHINIRGARSDAKGNFELRGVPEGKQLSLYYQTLDRRLAGESLINVPRGGDAPELTLRLNPTTSASRALLAVE